MVKSYYDYQLMRVRLYNRAQLKKDNTNMKEHPKNNAGSIVELEPDNYDAITEMAYATKEYEEHLEKLIKDDVRKHPMWTNFFKNVKGCGEMMAAVCLSEFDIEKATTVSKMWAFAGISPGVTRGRKWNKDKTEIILSDELVPQDRKTPDYLCPYNQWLRSKLIGVLAGCMIKSQSPYALKFYYPIHTPKERWPELGMGRLDQEENIYAKTGKPWKEESDGHRSNAAKRYMIKMFLLDLYVAWRTLEGLPVREPYQVEYLGHTHVA